MLRPGFYGPMVVALTGFLCSLLLNNVYCLSLSGEGKLISKDGTVYEGSFHNHRRHGEGKLMFRLDAVITQAHNRPYSWYPPSFHTLKDLWDKSSVMSFPREQKSAKIWQCKKSRLSLFTLDNRKWKIFHLKDKIIIANYGWKWLFCLFWCTAMGPSTGRIQSDPIKELRKNGKESLFYIKVAWNSHLTRKPKADGGLILSPIALHQCFVLWVFKAT